jgi:hypothetical protein
MRARATLLGGVSFAAFVAAASAQGCSLGLDQSLIDAGPPVDGSLPTGDDGPAPPPFDAGHDGVAPPPGDAAAACAKDTDCTSSNACRTGSCKNGHCVFDVCPTAACKGSSCEMSSSTCSAPVTYGFHAGAVGVSLGPVGCGGNAQACLAAAYPFVFVGTTNGVVAYAMNDPSNPTPPSPTITGLPFIPSMLVANGPRVYFVGSLTGGAPGGGPPYRLALAWVDVPADPLTSTLAATSVLDVYSEPALNGALAGPGAGLFLLDDDAQHFFPMALATAPLKDGATLAFNPSPGVPVGASPVVASGSRVLLARWSSDTTGVQTWFSLETGAATLNAQNSGTETSTLAAMGPTANQGAFAQGADGSVVWNAASAELDDAGTTIRAARVAWLVASGTTTTIDATTNLDVETYAPPLAWGTPVAGPVAWVDANTALVTAAAAGTTAQTSVQVAVRTPMPQLALGRRYVVPVGVTQVGAASSNGYGYVLAADQPSSCTLHAFAPACAQ